MGKRTHGPQLIAAIEANDHAKVHDILAKQVRNRKKIVDMLTSDLRRLASENTENPMILAAHLYDPSVLKYFISIHIESLLELRADTNSLDHKGRSPVHLAVLKADFRATKMLLAKGANPNIADKSGAAPMHLAAKLGHVELVKLLMLYNGDPYKSGPQGAIPLLIAAREGHLELLKFFYKAEININNKVPCYEDLKERAALHVAAEAGHHDAVILLLDQMHADLNIRDSEGESALHCALINEFDNFGMKSKEDYAEVVKALLRAGIDVNMRNGRGETALHLAARNEFQKVLDLLVQAGADPSLEDNDNNKPIDLVSEQDNVSKQTLKRAATDREKLMSQLLEFRARGYSTASNPALAQSLLGLAPGTPGLLNQSMLNRSMQNGEDGYLMPLSASQAQLAQALGSQAQLAQALGSQAQLAQALGSQAHLNNSQVNIGSQSQLAAAIMGSQNFNQWPLGMQTPVAQTPMQLAAPPAGHARQPSLTSSSFQPVDNANTYARIDSDASSIVSEDVMANRVVRRKTVGELMRARRDAQQVDSSSETEDQQRPPSVIRRAPDSHAQQQNVAQPMVRARSPARSPAPLVQALRQSSQSGGSTPKQSTPKDSPARESPQVQDGRSSRRDAAESRRRDRSASPKKEIIVSRNDRGDSVSPSRDSSTDPSSEYIHMESNDSKQPRDDADQSMTSVPDFESNPMLLLRPSTAKSQDRKKPRPSLLFQRVDTTPEHSEHDVTVTEASPPQPTIPEETRAKAIPQFEIVTTPQKTLHNSPPSPPEKPLSPPSSPTKIVTLANVIVKPQQQAADAMDAPPGNKDTIGSTLAEMLKEQLNQKFHKRKKGVRRSGGGISDSDDTFFDDESFETLSDDNGLDDKKLILQSANNNKPAVMKPTDPQLVTWLQEQNTLFRQRATPDNNAAKDDSQQRQHQQTAQRNAAPPRGPLAMSTPPGGRSPAHVRSEGGSDTDKTYENTAYIKRAAAATTASANNDKKLGTFQKPVVARKPEVPLKPEIAAKPQVPRASSASPARPVPAPRRGNKGSNASSLEDLVERKTPDPLRRTPDWDQVSDTSSNPSIYMKLDSPVRGAHLRSSARGSGGGTTTHDRVHLSLHDRAMRMGLVREDEQPIKKQPQLEQSKPLPVKPPSVPGKVPPVEAPPSPLRKAPIAAPDTSIEDLDDEEDGEDEVPNSGHHIAALFSNNIDVNNIKRTWSRAAPSDPFSETQGGTVVRRNRNKQVEQEVKRVSAGMSSPSLDNVREALNLSKSDVTSVLSSSSGYGSDIRPVPPTSLRTRDSSPRRRDPSPTLRRTPSSGSEPSPGPLSRRDTFRSDTSVVTVLEMPRENQNAREIDNKPPSAAAPSEYAMPIKPAKSPSLPDQEVFVNEAPPLGEGHYEELPPEVPNKRRVTIGHEEVFEERKLGNNHDHRVINFHARGEVRFSVSGGNMDGLFIQSVKPGSEAEGQGLLEGDQLLALQGLSVAGLTKEEVTMRVFNLREEVSLIVRHKKDLYAQVMEQGGVGDFYHVRACFNLAAGRRGDLAVQSGDIFSVRDSFPDGRLGSWFACKVSNFGKPHEDMHGFIPNQSRADELALAQSFGGEQDKESRFTRFRRSFKRSKSLDRNLDKVARQRSNSLDRGKLNKSMDLDESFGGSSTGYERVLQIPPAVVRPVILLGLFCDRVKDRLANDQPDRFVATPPDLEATGDPVVKVNTSVLQQIQAEGRHPLTIISPAAISYLVSQTQLNPIVIYLDCATKGVVKSLRAQLAPHFDKKPDKLHEEAQNFRKHNMHLFTATVAYTSNDGWYTLLKDTIGRIQNQPTWQVVSRERHQEILASQVPSHLAFQFEEPQQQQRPPPPQSPPPTEPQRLSRSDSFQQQLQQQQQVQQQPVRPASVEHVPDPIQNVLQRHAHMEPTPPSPVMPSPTAAPPSPAEDRLSLNGSPMNSHRRPSKSILKKRPSQSSINSNSFDRDSWEGLPPRPPSTRPPALPQHPPPARGQAAAPRWGPAPQIPQTHMNAQMAALLQMQSGRPLAGRGHETEL